MRQPVECHATVHAPTPVKAQPFEVASWKGKGVRIKDLMLVVNFPSVIPSDMKGLRRQFHAVALDKRSP
jgi:hypothetical protein